MEEPRSTIVEEREETMVSFSGDSQPVVRTAHFLTPNVTSIDGLVHKHPSLSHSSLPPTFEPKKWPIKVIFNGWRSPQMKWKTWVDCLCPKYQSLWKQAGIYEAIMCSTFHIRRDDDLVIGIAEKWNSETNTLVFPWGEATITLEDVVILGGFSVLGYPVPCSVESRDLEEIDEKLKEARTEVGRGPSKKACPWGWLNKFMGSGSKIEHEAFLSFWLARFVFKDSDKLLGASVFPMAIHLARGKRIALAPAVLASIYKDLRLLTEIIIASTEFEGGENGDHVLALDIRSPFHLVQMWAFERFQELQPKPNVIKYGDPRAARWDNVKSVKVENVRLALDSARESFRWRPYATLINNWGFPKFYKEKEEWVPVDAGLDEEMLSFCLCLRVSELCGLGCIEQYLPHRVAMQFGMVQDLPGHVARCNETPKMAWNNYIRPISETKLYVPSHFFESDVTIRYLEWWKQSVLVHPDAFKDAINGFVQRKRSLRKRSMHVNWHSIGRMAVSNADVPPKCIKDMINGVVRRKRSSRKRSKRVQWVSIERMVVNNADVPPDFPPKCNMEIVKDFVLEKKPTACNKHDIANEQVSDGKCYTGEAQGASTSLADYRAIRKESLTIPVANIRHNKGEMGGSNESGAGNPVSIARNINGNEEESSSSMLEMPGLELEAQIAKLERIVAELKASKFGHRFDRYPRPFDP